MARIGYARVSTEDQDLTVQRDRLAAAGCAIIRTETASGGTVVGRTELATIMEFIHAGDELVVVKLDRLRPVHPRCTEPCPPARRKRRCVDGVGAFILHERRCGADLGDGAWHGGRDGTQIYPGAATGGN